MSFSESAITLGRISVEYGATIGRPDVSKRLTTAEKTKELLRMCSRENVSHEGFVYLEKKLIK